MKAPRITRRAAAAFLAALGGSTVWPAGAQELARPKGAPAKAANALIELAVWKDASCGCCGDWIDHMQANGFKATVHDTGNYAVRARLGLDKRFGSCHTALVGGYVVEGHVPAREVLRLLREKPKALGLAVPGMPLGSPGMDGPVYGGRRDAYEVLLVQRDGTSRVFQAYSKA